MEITPNYKSVRSLWSSMRSFADWHALRTHALTQFGWPESRRRAISADNHGPVPWWCYGLTHFLDQMVSTDSKVLEIGGGASSEWWLARGNHVTTIESDQDWSAVIGRSCAAWSGRHRLVTEGNTSPAALAQLLEDEKFDVVVNDGAGDRGSLALVLTHATNDDGLLVWDNSDRSSDRIAISQLNASGWRSLEFFGIGPINAYASKSTVLYRGHLRQSGRSCTFDTVSY